MNNTIVLTFHVLRSIAIAALTCIAGAGCGTPREKPTFSRGWVGGQVVRVWNFPKALIPRPKSAILVRDLATNTPAALAGLREGDLILALDGEPVGKLLDYRRRIDSLTPGTSLRVTTW